MSKLVYLNNRERLSIKVACPHYPGAGLSGTLSGGVPELRGIDKL